MERSHAVIWSSDGEQGAGRLEPRSDSFELHGRNRRLSLAFDELTGVSIGRGRADRLLGLPVLLLHREGVAPVRIASLEGTGLLHELAERIERVRPAYDAVSGR